MKRIPVIALIMVANLSSAIAQVRVEAEKHATTIPHVCKSVVPASLEGKVDIAGLVKEAVCKGAGDMMTEYTYVMKSSSREKDKKGQVKKEETTTYEVYIPTLRGGTRATGVLLVTSRNGVPVPSEELEKERVRAGQRLEAAENKIARQPASLAGRVESRRHGWNAPARQVSSNEDQTRPVRHRGGRRSTRHADFLGKVRFNAGRARAG